MGMYKVCGIHPKSFSKQLTLQVGPDKMSFSNYCEVNMKLNKPKLKTTELSWVAYRDLCPVIKHHQTPAIKHHI